MIGALSGLGLAEYEAKRYEGIVKSGGILLSVLCDTSDEVSAAKKIIESAGGTDISSSSAGKSEPVERPAVRR